MTVRRDVDQSDDVYNIDILRLSTARSDYIFVESLTAGGAFAELWLGIDPRGRYIVAKVTGVSDASEAVSKTPPGQRAKMRESAIVRELNMQRLGGVASIQPVDAARIGARAAMIMPMYDGDAFALLSHRCTEQRIQLVRSMLPQLAAGLVECHRHGIMHLDVKLENILFHRAGQFVLADFGLAVPINQPLHGIYGTPGQMAPEMLAGAKIDEKVDTWALGLVIAAIYAQDTADAAFGFDASKLAEGLLKHRRFASWRQHIMPTGVHVDIKRLQRSHIADFAAFEALFAPLAQADPRLCEFLLERMLHPVARQRAGMREVQAHCKRHVPPADLGVVQPLLAAAVTTQRQQQLRLLDDVRIQRFAR